MKTTYVFDYGQNSMNSKLGRKFSCFKKGMILWVKDIRGVGKKSTMIINAKIPQSMNFNRMIYSSFEGKSVLYIWEINNLDDEQFNCEKSLAIISKRNRKYIRRASLTQENDFEPLMVNFENNGMSIDIGIINDFRNGFVGLFVSFIHMKYSHQIPHTIEAHRKLNLNLNKFCSMPLETIPEFSIKRYYWNSRIWFERNSNKGSVMFLNRKRGVFAFEQITIPTSAKEALNCAFDLWDRNGFPVLKVRFVLSDNEKTATILIPCYESIDKRYKLIINNINLKNIKFDY